MLDDVAKGLPPMEPLELSEREIALLAHPLFRKRPTVTRVEQIEIARRAFGDSLATRINMNTRLGDVPIQALREAIADALEAINHAAE